MFTKQESTKYIQELTNSYHTIVNYKKHKYHTFLIFLLALVIIITVGSIYRKEFNVLLASLLAIVGLSLEFRRLDFNKKVSHKDFIEAQSNSITMVDEIKEYFFNHIDDLEENKKRDFLMLLDDKFANIESKVAVSLFLISPSK